MAARSGGRPTIIPILFTIYLWPQAITHTVRVRGWRMGFFAIVSGHCAKDYNDEFYGHLKTLLRTNLSLSSLIPFIVHYSGLTEIKRLPLTVRRYVLLPTTEGDDMFFARQDRWQSIFSLNKTGN